MKSFSKTDGLFRHRWLGYVVALGAVVLATWLKQLAQPNIIPADVPILYIVSIVPIAIFFGLGPAIFTCILSVLAYNYFFIPPVHTLTPTLSELPILSIFLLIGVIISLLESNLKQKRDDAEREIAVRQKTEADLKMYQDHLEELIEQRTAELSASEERWSTTLASVGDAVIATDARGRITFMNSVAEGLTGWQLAEASQTPVATVFNIINEKTRQAAENPVNRVLDENIVVGLVNHTILLRKDGTEIPIDDSASPIRDRGSKTTGAVLIFRDITARRRAEDELSRVNRGLRAISDCNQVMVRATDEGKLLKDICAIVCDSAGYRMAWVGIVEHDNAKTVRPVAWGGAEEGYLKSIAISWEDTERGRGPTGSAARTGKTHFFQDFATEPAASPWREAALARGYRSSIAIPLADANSGVFGVLTLYAGQPSSFNPIEVELLEELAGDLAFGVSALRDRVKREQVEQELKESEERFRAIAETTPVGIGVVSIPEGHFLYVNKACEKAFGYCPGELLAHNTPDIYWDADDRTRLLKQLEGKDSVADFEIKLKRKDGTYFWSMPSISHINFEGKPALLGAFIDITEIKKAEEIKDEFISMVSHELRTPLTVVIGNIKVALSDGLSSGQIQGLVKDADLAAAELHDILENLVQLSRYQANKLILNVAHADIRNLLETTIARSREHAPDHRFYLKIEGELPPVPMDITKVSQIMANLLSNAAKYSPESSAVTVMARQENNSLLISVTDLGNGISSEEQKRLFQPFERLKETIGTKPGLGLGLLVCRRLVEAHGGKIWVASGEGTGSTFFFSLPISRGG